jgi:hypothetical protein
MEIIAICILGMVIGAIGIWFGLERFDRYTTTFIKYRQIGKIAGSFFILIASSYILFNQFKNKK